MNGAARLGAVSNGCRPGRCAEHCTRGTDRWQAYRRNDPTRIYIPGYMILWNRSHGWQVVEEGCTAMHASPVDRIEWLNDVIRLEIGLWNRIDARLRVEHDLTLGTFWPLYVVSRSEDASLRVGELAHALRLTVGGTSKIVDRLDAAGLLRREADVTDRRASRVVLTDEGWQRLETAQATYDAEMATVLDAALSLEEQRTMHHLVRRLLTVTDAGPGAQD